MNGQGPEGGAAPNTQFLHLEISQMLLAEGQTMARQVALDLMRDAIRERLRERLGPRLEALGRVAADDMVDDIEANLSIEAAIKTRTEKSRDLAQRVAEALKAK